MRRAVAAVALDSHRPSHRQPSRQVREARVRLGEPLTRAASRLRNGAIWIVERRDHGAPIVGEPQYGDAYCIVNVKPGS
jgi:hypothetical protein